MLSHDNRLTYHMGRRILEAACCPFPLFVCCRGTSLAPEWGCRDIPQPYSRCLDLLLAAGIYPPDLREGGGRVVERGGHG